MRKGIHPLRQWVNIITVKGGSFRLPMVGRFTRNELVLQVDPSVHPAWTGKKAELANTGQLAKFNSRFMDMSDLLEEPAAVAPAAARPPTEGSKKKK